MIESYAPIFMNFAPPFQTFNLKFEENRCFQVKGLHVKRVEGEEEWGSSTQKHPY